MHLTLSGTKAFSMWEFSGWLISTSVWSKLGSESFPDESHPSLSPQNAS